jgi:hypothetical protein
MNGRGGSAMLSLVNNVEWSRRSMVFSYSDQRAHEYMYVVSTVVFVQGCDALREEIPSMTQSSRKEWGRIDIS